MVLRACFFSERDNRDNFAIILISHCKLPSSSLQEAKRSTLSRRDNVSFAVITLEERFAVELLVFSHRLLLYKDSLVVVFQSSLVISRFSDVTEDLSASTYSFLLLLLFHFIAFAQAVLNAEIFLLGDLQLVAKDQEDAFILHV